MVDYCSLRLPCSQHPESSMGREAGRAVILIILLWVVCHFVSLNVAW